jgi:hypothetical protein
MKFKKKEAIIMAEAIIDHHMKFTNSDSIYHGWSCLFCGNAEGIMGQNIDSDLDIPEAAKLVKHEFDCPVLVAKKIY